LPNTPANQKLYNLYAIWYDAAVKPRGDRIYIHDVCSAFALYDYESDGGPMDDGDAIYEFMNVDCTIPHLANQENWGTITMKESFVDGLGQEAPKTSNIWCATKVANPNRYLAMLKYVCE